MIGKIAQGLEVHHESSQSRFLSGAFNTPNWQAVATALV
jgi:hypothetical protein